MSEELDLNTPIPSPQTWVKLCARLDRIRKGKPEIPAPPTPLILAGAAFSTAEQIRARWKEFLVWAQTHGLAAELHAALPAPDGRDYAKELAGYREGGPKWWEELEKDDEPA